MKLIHSIQIRYFRSIHTMTVCANPKGGHVITEK